MTTRQKVDALVELLAGVVPAGAEQRALSILQGCDDAELVAALRILTPRRLFSELEDHRIGPRNRTDLIELLCLERADVLDVQLRAEVIAALQDGPTGPHAERGIVELLTGTLGTDLTDLKTLLDLRHSYHNLYRLLYVDIDSARARERVLLHFAAEARPGPGLRVLSDIDDTLYCNWKDARYPKRAVYPGVRQLYAELMRGRPGVVAFLTARPGDRTGLVESLTLDSLRRKGLDRVTVVPGDLGDLVTPEAIAEGKYGHFLRYRDIFPEFDLVWCGDSGQGDALLARRLMLEGRARAAFIHDVVNTGKAERAAWAAEGVCFFDTYVGAARHARSLGLIDGDAAERVATAARDELDEIGFADRGTYLVRKAELDADIAALHG